MFLIKSLLNSYLKEIFKLSCLSIKKLLKLVFKKKLIYIFINNYHLDYNHLQKEFQI